MPVSLCTTYMPGYNRGLEKALEPMELESQGCEPPEVNALKEQYLLLTAEPSLQCPESNVQLF